MSKASSPDSLVEDYTKRWRQVEEVRFQADLLKSLGQAVIATDAKGTIIYWNEVAERLYNLKGAEVLGRSIREIFKGIILEDDPNTAEHIRSGKPWTGETSFKRHDGTLLATILSTNPIRDDKGEFCGVVGVLTDISNLKWMQGVLEEAVEAVTSLNEKLRVVDSLTWHDIRNKLTALNGRVYILKKRLGENSEACSNQRNRKCFRANTANFRVRPVICASGI